MGEEQPDLLTPGGTPIWTSGAGPTIVFIHGVLFDHRMWRPQVKALSGQYRTCCYDMLGHGAAPDPPGERSLDDFAAQVGEVIDQLSDNGPPVLCGFSMGGLVAQAYAAQHHARLAGLVLLNTVHDRSPSERATVLSRLDGNVAHGVENAVSSGIGRWFTELDHRQQPHVIDNVQRWMRHGDFTAKRKAHRVFVTSDAQVSGKLGVISCPTLVMTGARDAGSTPEMARKMAGAIPRSELHILDDQHHMMPTLAADPVNGIILNFLKRCQTPT